MLTEILIKPFIEDLKHEGIEDTTPYEQGFMAGMAALSNILSENIDNQAQLFTYLGMAISDGMQWVKSQVSESPEKAPSIKFEAPKEPFKKGQKVCIHYTYENYSYLKTPCIGIVKEDEEYNEFRVTLETGEIIECNKGHCTLVSDQEF